MRRIAWWGTCVWMLCSATVWGQAPETPSDKVENEAAAEASPFVEEEPTLPEVLVQPDEQEEPAPEDLLGVGEPTAAPITSTTPPATPPSYPYDLPRSYPSLSEQKFEGLDSALRSTRSIFDSPKATSIITRQDLLERQPRDMVEAIEREVGVLVQRTGRGQASPFIRGLTGPETLILVDGIRLNNSTFRYGPNQYFATIDPGMIERIEVVRGPQSVLWGSDAIGGVINVVTRSPEIGFCNMLGGQFIERFSTADNGSYSRMNVEGSFQRWGIFGGGSYLNVNDLDRGGDLGRQPFTDYSQYAGDIKFQYVPAPNQLLTVALQHLEQMDVPRTDKYPSEARRFDPQQRDLGYVRWQAHDLDNGLFDSAMLTFSLGRQKEGTIRRRPPESLIEDRSEFDVQTTGINLVFASELGFFGTLTYGVDYYQDEVDAVSNRFDLEAGTVTPRVPQYPNDSYYERAGAFLQWDVDLTERLSAVAGARYSNIEAEGTVSLFDPDNPAADPVSTPIEPNFQDWTGSVGLVYEINPCINLVGSVSEGFRAPLLDELMSVSDNVNEGIDIPNPDLSPETSINYEVGMKFDLDRIRAQTFVFWTELDNLIDRRLVGTVPDPLVPGGSLDVLQRRNVGNAELQGFELAGELLLTPEWSIYGNYTYIYGINTTDNEPFSRIPPAQGVIGLRWRDREAANWFDVYGWLVARQDRLSDRDTRDSRIPPGGTPGYGTLNVRLGRQISDCQRVTLGIENILDKAYRVHGSGVDGPGISGQLGYEVVF